MTTKKLEEVIAGLRIDSLGNPVLDIIEVKTSEDLTKAKIKLRYL